MELEKQVNAAVIRLTKQRWCHSCALHRSVDNFDPGDRKCKACRQKAGVKRGQKR